MPFAIILPVIEKGAEALINAIVTLIQNGGKVVDLSTLTVVDPQTLLAQAGITQEEIDKILS
jgi:hypothetical protein